MNPTMLSRVQGCLMGVAIGDAMGMPWEIMTPDEIYLATEGRGVTGFTDPVQRNIKGTMKLKAGDTTDDWQLTRAVARALVRKRKFDIGVIAHEHVVEYQESSFGWGKTTEDAVMGFLDYGLYGTVLARDPYLLPSQRPRPELGKSCGNGPAMKVSPLALFHAIRLWRDEGNDMHRHYDALRRDVVALGAMTHDDGRATVAAYSIAHIIIRSMMRPLYVRPSSEDVFKQVASLEAGASAVEQMPIPWWPLDNRFSSRFVQFMLPGVLDDGAKLRETTGTSCFSLESVPFSIGTFLRHPMDFRAGVLEAVNAGGDTDSNASMVGAMIGANVGIEEIPEEWKNFRPEYEEVVRLGTELFTAAFKSK